MFYETSASNTFITLWVWNSSTNFTGGSWPGQNATLMGKTEDGTRLIFKWTYDGEYPANNMPTGLIFSQSGNNQTSNLQFVNHGYYIDGVYERTITEQEPVDPSVATLSVDKDSGEYIDEVTVTVTSSFSNATIVYTTDGSAPTASSERATGSLTLTFNKTTTLRAGVLHNGVVKNTITRTYKIRSSHAEKLHAYFIAPSSWTNTIYCWAWNAQLGNKNYTGGIWPGQACNLVGSNLYNGLDIWEWDGGVVGDDLPTGIIFSNHGSPQTADFNFVNGAFYDQNGIVSMKIGDVDFDGVVTSTDITAIYNVLLGIDDAFAFHADVDGDGVVTATDITVIYNILLGN
ncbi:MAG: starch-binding protein [Muribaculaceae bacterium]|nr:starch-binding protein [Muribaculaceae bacterium]